MDTIQRHAVGAGIGAGVGLGVSPLMLRALSKPFPSGSAFLGVVAENPRWLPRSNKMIGVVALTGIGAVTGVYGPLTPSQGPFNVVPYAAATGAAAGAYLALDTVASWTRVARWPADEMAHMTGTAKVAGKVAKASVKGLAIGTGVGIAMFVAIALGETKPQD